MFVLFRYCKHTWKIKKVSQAKILASLVQIAYHPLKSMDWTRPQPTLEQEAAAAWERPEVSWALDLLRWLACAGALCASLCRMTPASQNAAGGSKYGRRWKYWAPKGLSQHHQQPHLPLPACWAVVNLGYRIWTQPLPCASSTNSPGRDLGRTQQTCQHHASYPFTSLSYHFEISQKTVSSTFPLWLETHKLLALVGCSPAGSMPKTDPPLYHLKPPTVNSLGKCVCSSASSHLRTLNTNTDLLAKYWWGIRALDFSVSDLDCTSSLLFSRFELQAEGKIPLAWGRWQPGASLQCTSIQPWWWWYMHIWPPAI